MLDPQNMGLDTLIVELCALLAGIWRNIHFPVMASLINRNCIPGGARYPLLPTRLIGPLVKKCI